MHSACTSHGIYIPPLQTQIAYEEYCTKIRELYSDEFWHVFSSVYMEQSVIIDKVLKACRSTFIRDKKMHSFFHTSVRAIRNNILAKAGDFPSLVMHSITIDLSEFGIPGFNRVEFRFVNPLWGWILAANNMLDAGHSIQFSPKTLHHETTNDLLYGAGVAYGKKLQWAVANTPRGGKPAFFGISFDGADTGVGARNMVPVCVSVLNFDGAEPLACALLGYVPSLDVPQVFKKRYSKNFLRAKAHVLQRCIGAILDEIENVAQHGFAADLGEERVRLHPFLVAINVDSKERKMYFGLKSDR